MMDASTLLRATEFLDHDAPDVAAFASRSIGNITDPSERAVALYYAVRDGIRYDVYDIDLSRAALRASAILRNKVGFCIHKSIVFATLARHVGIPSRLSFSDVYNHLSTPRLRELVGGEVFSYHAHAELWLHERWIKVTPVFNANLCRLFGVPALEFDGEHDATLQSFDPAGTRHLRPLRDHGTFEDFPFERCIAALRANHPKMFDTTHRTRRASAATERRTLPGDL